MISVMIAALALLLTWHREREPRRPRLFGAAAVGVFGAGAVAVALIVLLEPLEHESAPTAPRPPRLTAAEYQQDAASICTRLNERIDRLAKIRPQGSAGSVTVQIEQEALDDLGRLQPPRTMETAHRDVVAVWKRRVTLIDELYRQRDVLSDREAIARSAEVDRLTVRLNRRLRALGVDECLMS